MDAKGQLEESNNKWDIIYVEKGRRKSIGQGVLACDKLR